MTPVSHLTRAQLCARIWTVKRALDDFQAQAEADGQGALDGYGALKVSHVAYRAELRKRDEAAQRGEPIPAPVLLAMAGRSALTGQVIRDPAEKQVDLWRVVFDGEILPIEWQSKGAAEIHLGRCQAAGRALA